MKETIKSIQSHPARPEGHVDDLDLPNEEVVFANLRSWLRAAEMALDVAIKVIPDDPSGG